MWVGNVNVNELDPPSTEAAVGEKIDSQDERSGISPRDSIIDFDISEPYDPCARNVRPASGYSERTSGAQENKRESTLRPETTDSYVAGPLPGVEYWMTTPPGIRSLSSAYSRTTRGNTLPYIDTNAANRLDESARRQPRDSLASLRNRINQMNNVGPSRRSVHFEDETYSIAPSFASWQNLPSYDSSSSPNPPASPYSPVPRPSPLRISNTSREQAREDHMLPLPKPLSVYAGYSNPRYDQAAEPYGDVSPPDSPPADRCSRGDDGGYDVSPIGSPCLKRGTRWSGLYR